MSEDLNLPDAPPLTPGRWLLRSLAWTGGSLAGLAVLVAALLRLFYRHWLGDGELLCGLLFAGSCGAHWLLWQRALTGGAAACGHPAYQPGFSGVLLLAVAWRFGLLVFQGACLLVLLLLALGGVLCMVDADVAPYFGR